MIVIRLLCALRGHRERIAPIKAQPLVTAFQGGRWRVYNEVSCWCGKTHYLEGQAEQ